MDAVRQASPTNGRHSTPWPYGARGPRSRVDPRVLRRRGSGPRAAIDRKDVSDRPRQLCEIVIADHERRSEVDDAAHRADPDAFVGEAGHKARASTGRSNSPLAARSPNCNPHAERLDQFVIFGDQHLRYLAQAVWGTLLDRALPPGVGSRIIMPTPSPSNDNAIPGRVGCRSRLGGLLNYCRRGAA
jgi:hypothetical protein